jgi:hypothetical protein
METPLIKPSQSVVFAGKSYNKHPQWKNEPLRLTEEQKNDPILVLTDFFQSYHLKDTREILWDWLTEVISSTRRLSSNPHDRGNQLYFYERIEELIEAASLITKSAQPEKREDSGQHFVDLTKEGISNATCFSENFEADPFYALKQVFNPDKTFIIEEVKEWLLIGLSADSTIYDEAEQRSSLIAFYDQLIVLIEALFVITLVNFDKTKKKEELSKVYSITELSTYQQAEPEKVLAAFFEKYPIKQINRELDNWYEASISYSGEWRGNVICLQQVWDIYRNVQCVIKSAELLLKHAFVTTPGM